MIASYDIEAKESKESPVKVPEKGENATILLKRGEYFEREWFRKAPTTLALWAVVNKKTDHMWLWMIMRVRATSGKYDPDIGELCDITGFNEKKVNKIIRWLEKHYWINIFGEMIFLRSAKRICVRLGLPLLRAARFYFNGKFKEWCVAVGLECLRRSLASCKNARENLSSKDRKGISNSLIADYFSRSLTWAVRWKYKAHKERFIYTKRRYLDSGYSVAEYWATRDSAKGRGESCDLKRMVVHGNKVMICISNHIETGIELCRV